MEKTNFRSSYKSSIKNILNNKNKSLIEDNSSVSHEVVENQKSKVRPGSFAALISQ